jgi:hypothetical protein
MDLVTIATGLAGSVIVLSSLLPKIMASLKRDKLDATVATTQISQVDGIQSTYEKQIHSLYDRLNKMELRVNEMDETIHFQAVKVTRLIVVVIQLKSIMTEYAVPIPEHLKEEIDRLTLPPKYTEDKNEVQ